MMMRTLAAWGSLAACAACVHADGFLWLAGEFNAPTRIYRLNMSTGLIDLTVDYSASVGDVANNLAYDGTNLYVGEDDADTFITADALTGAPTIFGTYSGQVTSSWEDGAYNPATGTLWRAAVTGSILENDSTGAAVSQYFGSAGLDGLEWYGGTLYATDFFSFGSVALGGGAFVYTPLALTGVATGQLYYGLAEDQSTGKLYMATHGSFNGIPQGYIYEIDTTLLTATVAFDLNVAGYPLTGDVGWINPDAMGWVPIPAPGALTALGLAGLVAARRRR